MKLQGIAQDENGLSDSEISALVRRSLNNGTYGPRKLQKVLILPPDYTRYYSNAGRITNLYYHDLTELGAEVDIMPALGTHVPVTQAQWEDMFGDIPFTRMLVHDWRKDVVSLGEVPGAYLSTITEGLWKDPIEVEVNRRVMDESYDLILSVGQVVPHEVIGMSNHSKNIFVGVGGADMINKSHMVGAVYGMERMMGRDFTPVRKVFDYALAMYLSERPIVFALTVTTAPGGKTVTHGLFIGDTRDSLSDAIALAQQKNIDFLPHSIRKCVVFLDPKEFHTTWLGNKAVYRTRMAMADGGELLILAPGITHFGEDAENDRIIRRYGYCGRLKVLDLFRQPENADLRENMGVAAHLIHGSSDGRFRITYAVRNITAAEIESVHYAAASYDEMIRRYDPEKLAYGWNTMPDGEEIFFVPNPALGLWIDKTRFED